MGQMTTNLTAREKEVIRAVCMSTDTLPLIAPQLNIRYSTLKRIMSNVCDKTGMGSRLEVMFWAWEHGIVKCPCGKANG